MKKLFMVVAVATIGISFGAGRTTAQGPQGVGASVAAGSGPSQSSHSSHSLNPIKWVKKSPKPASDQLDARSDRDKKLTAKFQAQGLLPANTDLKSACDTFKNLDGCVAALHVSHNLGVEFNCLKSDLTGVQTSADMSGCKGTAGTKAMSLDSAIRALKPEANAKAEAKNAVKQAHDDLKEAGA
ncbi:MAG TPA: hypothetical protein VHF01_10135 [Candidatus Acidoferrum sp.]|nr:hypothetical protein [Candidatus Acidoferrum sp.]